MEEAYKVELVYTALQEAKRMIALVYKQKDRPYTNPCEDITDEKINDYYYRLNDMCCELADRNVMVWQKED